MVTDNHIAVRPTELTPAQLKVLQGLLTGYLATLQVCERERAQLNEVIGNIAGAYLAGLGFDPGLTVHLATGRLTNPHEQVGPGLQSGLQGVIPETSEG